MAWVTGNRDTATFKMLYDKIKHNENCIFFTDNWDAFSKILPKNRHIIGKAHTIAIEQNNSNTRHYLGRMTRRSKIISRSEEMLNIRLKLWCAFTEYGHFDQIYEVCKSIFN